jgi:hypothetical protein
MDEWDRIRSGIRPAEQALRDNAYRLCEQLENDPDCNKDLIQETLKCIEGMLATMTEVRSP